MITLEVNLTYLIKHNITADQYVFLYLFYYKNFSTIKDLFGVSNAVSIRNSLLLTPYILSDVNVKFLDTILSTEKVEKLLNIRHDKIEFDEFYFEYPVKVGSRILRSSGTESEAYKKHKKKYLEKVKKIEQHKLAIEATKAYVAKKRQANELKYLNGIEVVINNSLWEIWTEFIDEKSETDWNSKTI